MKIRKLHVFLLIVITVAASFSLLSAGTSHASGIQITSVYHDYLGYNGNDTIYMSTGVKSMPLGDTSTANVYEENYKSNPNNPDSESYRCIGSMGIATGNKVAINNDTAAFCENYNPSAPTHLVVQMPVIVVSHYFCNITMAMSEPGEPHLRANITANLSGFNAPRLELSQAMNCMDAGYNISFMSQNKVSDSHLSSYLDGISAAAGTIALVTAYFPVVSVPAGAVSVITSLMSLISTDGISNSNCQYVHYGPNLNHPTGGETYQSFPVVNGTQSYNPPTTDTHNGTYNYSNIFSASEFLTMCIPSTAFNTTTGKLDITGIQGKTLDGLCERQMANSGLVISFLPAITLTGTALINRHPSQTHVALVSSNGTEYVLNTNAEGQYRFMAKPDTSYTLYEINSAGDFSQTSSEFTTPNGAGSYSENISANGVFITPVTFHESGLPSGAKWYVNITDGTSYSSTGPTISFDEVNGTYNYEVSISDKTYEPSPSSGSFTTNGAPVSESIGFSQVTYEATFYASGLPSGSTWYVNIIGGASYSSTGPTISFDEVNGTYNYGVSTSNSNYEPSSSSGSFTIGGSAVSEDIAFSELTYPVYFHEQGLPSGASWEVDFSNGDYGYSSGSTLTVNAPSSSYTYYVEDASVTHSNGDIYIYDPAPSSGSVTVNSGGQTISVTYELSEVESGGGGRGGGCVNGTTEILMANFTYMQAQYILPGDYVLAYNITTHEYQPEEVLDTYISEHTTQYTINGFLETSAYQPVLTNHGYVKAGNLTSNDRVFDAFTGQYVKIFSITESTGHFKMYDFQIPPDYDFIAWEYVVYDMTIR